MFKGGRIHETYVKFEIRLCEHNRNCDLNEHFSSGLRRWFTDYAGKRRGYRRIRWRSRGWYHRFGCTSSRRGRADRWSFGLRRGRFEDRKSTRLNSSHGYISYAVFCLKKKKKK